MQNRLERIYFDHSSSRNIIQNDINYNKETGQLFWNKSGKGRKLSRPVGTTTKQGYLQTTIGGKQLKVHHVIWFIETGEWPKEQIDHKDKIKNNNKFVNLREGTSINQHNRKIKVGKSGLSGAYWSNEKGRWYSNIRINGSTKFLGYFSSKEAANIAYTNKKKEILNG